MLTLIASLGQSPGVITGTIDALIDEGLRPRRVYTATTSDSIIWSYCIPLLIKEFNSYYRGIELITDMICLSREDIYDEHDNAEFMRKVAIVMNQERAANNEIYLSLASGRKTMSAAMAVLGQIYGVKELLHVLVDSEYEKNVKDLIKLTEEEREMMMHPPRDKRRLIRFPVFAIPWETDEVIEALERGYSENSKLNSIISKMDSGTRRLLVNILKNAGETR